MQLKEITSAQWESVIADLTAKRQATLTQLEQLRAEKRALALEAAMGSEDARQRLRKIATELNRASLEVDELQMALAQADAEKQKTKESESAAAEAARQQAIASALREYYATVKQIDDALRMLAQRFEAAAGHLSRAESHMRDPEWRILQQAPGHSAWGPTIAACVHGLAKYLSFGAEAAYARGNHAKDLQTYVRPLIARWLPAPVNGKEPTNGDRD